MSKAIYDITCVNGFHYTFDSSEYEFSSNDTAFMFKKTDKKDPNLPGKEYRVYPYANVVEFRMTTISKECD